MKGRSRRPKARSDKRSAEGGGLSGRKGYIMKKALSVLLAIALCASLAACGSSAAAADTAAAKTVVPVSERKTEAGTEAADAVEIALSPAGIAAGGDGVRVSGSTVTITAGGTYRLTGTLTDGQIAVDAPDAKVTLILDGADVTCAGSAALYVAEADKVTLFLADGAVNYLTSSGEFTDPEGRIDAALFARDDVTITGEGALTVESETGHGIVSKDDLKVKGGEITVTAAKKGLSGSDSLKISGGSVTVSAGTDALHAEKEDDASPGSILIEGGKISLSSGSDGMDANGTITITDGEITIRAADDAVHSDSTFAMSGGSVLITESYEGLEARNIEISGGEIELTASDDGFNAVSGSSGGGRGGGFAAQSGVDILISGGTILINAGGDGLDSNGDLTVTGGTIYVSGPTDNGNGALDYNGVSSLSGGVVIAAGAAGMAESLSPSGSQGVILYNLTAVQEGGAAVTLSDADGNVLCSFTPSKSYQSLVVSAPGIVSGGTYTLACGSLRETITLNGLSYSNGGFGMGGGFGGWGGPAEPGNMPKPPEGMPNPPVGMPEPPEGMPEPPGGMPGDQSGQRVPDEANGGFGGEGQR